MAESRTTSNRKYSKTLIVALLVLVFVSAMVLTIKEPPYNNIENDELQLMLDNKVPLYDVRRPDEWRQTGVIENSHLLTFVGANGYVKPDFLSRFTAEVNKDDAVILICRTGNRTSKLARYLADELGYTNIYNVDDGISHWIREKRPVKNVITRTSEIHSSRGS